MMEMSEDIMAELVRKNPNSSIRPNRGYRRLLSMGLLVPSNMNRAELSGCSIHGATFTSALLRDAMWIAANLVGANFGQANPHARASP